MMDKIRSRAGRLFLLAIGVLLTSTVGHAAARLMAAQMALGAIQLRFRARRAHRRPAGGGVHSASSQTPVEARR